MSASIEFDVTADDGVRLHGERWPAGRRGAPVVLGLHGITGTRRGFLPTIDALAGDVEFVSFDHRGRGLSDKPADPAAYGHRRNAEDAACVLRALGAGPVVVVGQSMGAWVGSQLAAHHPYLVRALVLVDGGYFLDVPEGLAPSAFVADAMGDGWLDRLRATYPSREVVLAAFRGLPAFQGWWSEQVEDLLLAGLEDAPGGVRSRCSAVGAEVDSVDYFVPFGGRPYVKADLSLVACPVSLVRAEHGFMVSPESMAPLLPERAVEELHGALPQLQVQTIPGTNHYSVNFGPEGAAVIADTVRKALP